jgi:hypothetical protein
MIDMLLEYNCRLCAQRAYGHIWLHTLQAHASAPVCYPDDPDLIVRFNNGIL